MTRGKSLARFLFTSSALAASLASGPLLAWENEGRMTGGGVFVCVDGSGVTHRITHGFELHCNIDGVAEQTNPNYLPNNLQVNWDSGNHFHLVSLTRSDCIDDDQIEAPPVAGFYKFKGEGVGIYNQQAGFGIEFKFTDVGEPGNHGDAAWIRIYDAVNGNNSNSTVLGCYSKNDLLGGNHQAHRVTGRNSNNGN